MNEKQIAILDKVEPMGMAGKSIAQIEPSLYHRWNLFYT